MAINNRDKVFHSFAKHELRKFDGRLIRIEKRDDPFAASWKVGLIIHIPEGEADELEIYRRINQVITVVCMGNEPEST